MRQIKVAVAVVLAVALFASGFFFGHKSVKPVIVTRDKIVYKTITREPNMPPEVCCNHLWHYDNDVPKLDLEVLDKSGASTNVRMTASLYQREWHRDAQLEIGSSQNWKFYLGLGLGAACVGAIGFGIYKLATVL